MLENLFIYATLKDREVQKQVIGRAIEKMVIDVLENYSMKNVKIDGKIYPIIFPKQNFSVAGYVIPVSDEELRLIDEHEGSSYKREKVQLVSGKEALTYIENESI